MIRSSIMMSEIFAIEGAINTSLSQANEKNLTSAKLWQRVAPIVGRSPRQELVPEELSSVIFIEEFELAQKITEMFMRYDVFIQSVEDYSNRREKLKELFNSHELTNDGAVISKVTLAQAAASVPYELELESLIEQIRREIPGLKSDAEHVVFRLGPAARKRFNDSKFPIFHKEGN